MNSSSQLESIFFAALEKGATEERSAYLDEACSGDETMRRRVERMLDAQAGSFLDAPIIEGQPTTAMRPIAEQPGAVIGPYKLLQQIGEGGMGVVFMAEQAQPLQRKVALKVIKPGMDSRQVIARFGAERQALAMMDHPNVAKVLDAGATDSGRPYFVMELIHGVAVTEYCDQCNLTTRERLELFIVICQAVQHAHQNGVIHRDLKPTNMLVALQDGLPSIKIIDFGIAKAIGRGLADHTMTAFAQMIGTPLYMSPEQAELSPLGVDTRTDVYSLGVILYELLTGTTPLEKERLHTAPYDELRRIVREEEPQRPSARLSTLAADLATTVAEHRRTKSRRLKQQMHGDLDWIVMKCLEKDRTRRYETASALAADVRRYLHDEPVTAAAPSRLYRAGKFVRRYKWPVIAATAVLLGLVAGVIGMAIGLVSQSQLLAVAEQRQAEAQLNLATSLHSQGKYTEAEALYRAGLKSANSVTVEDRRRVARTRLHLAKVVYAQGDPVESERLYREAFVAYREDFPPDDPNIAHALITFALLLREQQRFDEAESSFREAYEIYRRATPANHRAIGESATHLANVLITLGRYAEAEPLARDAIAQQPLAVPHDDLALAFAQVELGRALVALGRFSEAERELLDAERVITATDHFRVGMLAAIALYTKWDQSEPGKGYDAESQQWTRKLIGTFVRLNETPADLDDGSKD